MVAILGFSKDQITAAVRAMYGQVAAMPMQQFHFPVGRQAALALDYPAAELDQLPGDVVDRFAGVGYPFRAGTISRGDTVLDIGAGAGVDTLIASLCVGERGKVWALDITPEMLATLNAALRDAHITNVETVEADAERIPLEDSSVDVVSSNGALNLVPDKRRAFAEIVRVLRPGGRLQLADVVISRPVPLGGRSDPQLWAECVVGASIKEDYLALLEDAGLADVEVVHEYDYFAESPSAETRRIASGLGARSIVVSARRPAEPVVPGLASRLFRRLGTMNPARISSLGLWGAIAAAASVAACYGTIALLGMLSLFGLTISLDEGAWALAITATAALAAIATAFNLRRHGRPWPLLMAAIGAAVIGYVMFAAYHPVIEALGFVALLGAVGLDLYCVYQAECVPRHHRAQETCAQET
jgi:arsenite methyltransferase